MYVVLQITLQLQRNLDLHKKLKYVQYIFLIGEKSEVWREYAN